MNRKIDKDLQEYQPAFFPQNEEVMNVVPTESGIQRVVFDCEFGSDRSKKVLDPKKIDMQAIIESGEVIEPKDFMRQFNIRDAADLEEYRLKRSKYLFDYVKEHKDEIKQLLAEKVNPLISE